MLLHDAVDYGQAEAGAIGLAACSVHARERTQQVGDLVGWQAGAAVGNTAFLGIPGKPALYMAAPGTTTATLSEITLTPPPGNSTASSYMLVVGDAESSNGGESLDYVTNGGNWTELDRAGPISGITASSAAIRSASLDWRI